MLCSSFAVRGDNYILHMIKQKKNTVWIAYLILFQTTSDDLASVALGKKMPYNFARVILGVKFTENSKNQPIVHL
jgi:hypothetical protein